MSLKMITIPQVTVATAGTEQRLSSAAISNAVKAYVSAPATNTGSIWIGDSDVAVGRGVEVIKGTTLTLEAQEGQLIDIYETYVDAATNGDKASITYYSKV